MTRQVVDTNILVRHFTGAPAHQARAATAFLKSAGPGELLLTDVHVAEFVWVLESSIYQADRATVAAAVDAALALPAIEVVDEALLQVTIDLYSHRGMDWTDAYLVATAIAGRVPEVASFDRFDSKLNVGVRRLDPGRTAR